MMESVGGRGSFTGVVSGEAREKICIDVSVFSKSKVTGTMGGETSRDVWALVGNGSDIGGSGGGRGIPLLDIFGEVLQRADVQVKEDDSWMGHISTD